MSADSFDLRVLDAMARKALKRREDITHQTLTGTKTFEAYQFNLGYLRALEDLFFDEASDAVDLRKEILER